MTRQEALRILASMVEPKPKPKPKREMTKQQALEILASLVPSPRPRQPPVKARRQGDWYTFFEGALGETHNLELRRLVTRVISSAETYAKEVEVYWTLEARYNLIRKGLPLPQETDAQLARRGLTRPETLVTHQDYEDQDLLSMAWYEDPYLWVGPSELRAIFAIESPGMTPTERDLNDMAEAAIELAMRQRDVSPPTRQAFRPSLSAAQQTRASMQQRVMEDEGYLSVATINDLVRRVRPIDKDTAVAFVRAHHSELPSYRFQGLLAAVGLWYGNQIRAVGMVNTPSGRESEQDHIIDVSRIASDGSLRGASSAIMAWVIANAGALARPPSRKPPLVVTYSLVSEEGTTYKALEHLGLRPVGLVRPSSGGSRPQGTALKNKWKIRWEQGDQAQPAKPYLTEFHRAVRAKEEGRTLASRHFRGFGSNPEAMRELYRVLGGDLRSARKAQAAYRRYTEGKAAPQAAAGLYRDAIRAL